jgi:hypothetical protein
MVSFSVPPAFPVHQMYQLTCASGVSADLCTRCTVFADLYCTSNTAVGILLLFSTLVSCYLVHQLFKQICSFVPWCLLQVRSSRNQVKKFWNLTWRLLYSYFTCSCFAPIYSFKAKTSGLWCVTRSLPASQIGCVMHKDKIYIYFLCILVITWRT